MYDGSWRELLSVIFSSPRYSVPWTYSSKITLSDGLTGSSEPKNPFFLIPTTPNVVPSTVIDPEYVANGLGRGPARQSPSTTDAIVRVVARSSVQSLGASVIVTST